MDQLTLFAEGTPASPLALPGDDKARKMTAISGRKLIGSWLSSGRLGSLERTLLGTSAWASTACFLTWTHKATPQGRLLFQLAPSVPRTDATGFGSSPRKMMPTPTASDHIERESTSTEAVNPLTGKSVSLDRFVRFWPTSEAQASGVPRMWPTPSASDNRDRGNMSSPAVARRKEKGKQIMLSQSVSPESGALNPAWVEWLMGYPTGYTDLRR